MNIGEIYQLAIRMGTNADPRGEKAVNDLLKERKEKYNKLSRDDKSEFDTETLENPYSDSRILNGDSKNNVKRVLTGIDIEPSEVILADRLSEKGKQIDLIIAHHPEGKALANLNDVMHIQEDLMHMHGVPINVAEGLMNKRIAEVSRGFAPINHNRSVDTASILGINFMCVHTPADNLVYSFVQKLMDRERPKTVGDVVKILKTIPEYKKAIEIGAGPRIFNGSESGRAGKIAVLEMTGGTEGAKEMYERISHAGVGTVLSMHQSEAHRKEAEKYHVNVVVAGHISSDSIGLNLFLDELGKKGIEIIPCSGLIRIKRYK